MPNPLICAENSEQGQIQCRILWLCIGLTCLATAQQTIAADGLPFNNDEPTPQYEVSAIKPNHSGAMESSVIPTTHGTLTAVNATLEDLILWAYGVPRYRLADAPAWSKTERFDISAKTGPAQRTYTRQEIQQMFQQLLADRFEVKTHYESRTMPIYALVVSYRAHLPAPSMACIEITPTTSVAELGTGIPCGNIRVVARGHLVGARITSDLLAKTLGGLGRPVIDETHLDGQRFDIDLRWTPETDSSDPTSSGTGNGSSSTQDTGPSIFTAIREQLGLRLESRRSPVDVLIIDSASRPKEN